MLLILFQIFLSLVWNTFFLLGNVTCSAYPLEYLDTIHSETGDLQTKSALNLIGNADRRPADQVSPQPTVIGNADRRPADQVSPQPIR